MNFFTKGVFLGENESLGLLLFVQKNNNSI